MKFLSQIKSLPGLAHDLELAFAERGYLEHTYTGNDVSSTSIYSDATKGTKLFEIEYTYDSLQRLSTKTVTRMSDNATRIMIFGYDSAGRIKSITTT